jgi:hypothetical protein
MPPSAQAPKPSRTQVRLAAAAGRATDALCNYDNTIQLASGRPWDTLIYASEDHNGAHMPRSRPPLVSLSLMTISVHEAGHAVAHLLYKIPMKHVSVIPEGESGGHVLSADKRRDTILNQNWNERRSRSYAERLIKCALAGEVAQNKYKPSSFHQIHSSHDWENAVSFASSQSGSFEEAMAWCNLLLIQTKQDLCIEYNSAAIVQLARRLKSDKILSSREARRIAELAKGGPI